MITGLTLGGNSLLSQQWLLQSFNNGSFPATVYTRSKRGGYQGNKLITPSFASFSFVLEIKIVGTSFSDLALQRDAFLGILGLVHSQGIQTLISTRSDGTSRQLDIKAIEVTGDISVDDGTSSLIQVTLLGEYPFLMGSNPKNQDVLISNGGGFAVPFAIPFDMSAGHSTLVTINNVGNYAAYPIFSFFGPLTNPTITNNTTGKTLSVAQTLADSAHSLIVDTYQRTAVLQTSGNNARQYISGTFWTIPIGISTVTLTAGSGELGKCTVAFRDTFLNI